MSNIRRVKTVTAAALLAAGIAMGGVGSAYAGWSATSPDGGASASVNTARTTFSVRDTTGDGNRAYGDYWRNTSGNKYSQLITRQVGEVVSVSLSGSTRVASFRACNDHPIAGDNCSTRKYI